MWVNYLNGCQGNSKTELLHFLKYYCNFLSYLFITPRLSVIHFFMNIKGIYVNQRKCIIWFPKRINSSYMMKTGSKKEQLGILIDSTTQSCDSEIVLLFTGCLDTIYLQLKQRACIYLIISYLKLLQSVYPILQKVVWYIQYEHYVSKS